MAWAVCINNTFGECFQPPYDRSPANQTCIAGVLSLTFPRMQTVMTPTGACK